MFETLKKWWDGELIDVEIVECKNVYRHNSFEFTIVSCPDKTRKYVLGHLGAKGEKIRVNTWDLRTFGLLP